MDDFFEDEGYYTPPEPKKPKRGIFSKILMGLGVLFLLFIIISIIAAISSSGKNKDTTETSKEVTESQEQTTENEAVATTPESTTEAEAPVETTTEPQSDLTIGQAFESGNFSITLDQLVTSPGDGNLYVPEAGYEYLTSYWTVRNNGNEDSEGTVLIDAYVDGKAVEQEFVSGLVDTEPLNVSNDLLGGTEIQGTYTFMVPVDFQELKFRVTLNGESTTYVATVNDVTAG